MIVLRSTLFFICSLLLLFGVLIAPSVPGCAQTNINGIINDYTPVTGVSNNCACPTADCGSISVVSASAFEVGDTVLLIQMKGAQADTTNTSSHGGIIALNDAGNYEFAVISAISGNTITTAAPLGETYFTNASPVDSACVQLIRVPHYPGNVNVTGTLTAQTWNGRTGGVLAFFADGTVTLNADISVDGLGFRKAKRKEWTISCTLDTNYYYQSTSWHYSCNGPYKPECEYLYPDSPTRVADQACNGGTCSSNAMTNSDNRMAGFRGEGIVAVTFTKTFPNGNIAIFEKGKGRWGNGGGGGGTHNAGGGGGGNYGAGGFGGNAYDQSACDAGTYVSRRGYGGANLTPTSSKVFMGGGGGEGHYNVKYIGGTTGGTTGTNGGGIIFIGAQSITNNGSYTITANGLDRDSVAYSDGAGGGGAGGSILLDIPGSYTSPIAIEAKGGKGGDHLNGTCHGTGGGGGGGVIWLSQSSQPSNVTIDISAGINGIQIAPSFSCDPDTNWGATPGSDGTSIYEGNSGFFNENTCGVLLPVEWISFDAWALDLSIGLHWQTGTESNNDHFVIERSIDGITYREIGMVKGSGTTRSAQTYQFTDQNPISGINYYRIKQVDYNGESTYSRVVQAKIILPTIEWSIAPNPTNHSLTATLDLPWRQDGELVIMDVFGKQLVRQPVTLDKGSHTINLDVSTLIPGWYVIALMSDNARLYKKFLKN